MKPLLSPPPLCVQCSIMVDPLSTMTLRFYFSWCKPTTLRVKYGVRRRGKKNWFGGFKTFHRDRWICRLLLFYLPRYKQIYISYTGMSKKSQYLSGNRRQLISTFLTVKFYCSILEVMKSGS